MSDLTVIILTKNEEKNIGACISSARDIAKRIIVVDSYSSDATIDVARDNGAEVMQHQFVSHAIQFQWALDNSNINTTWVLRLDADERLTESSRAELQDLCDQYQDGTIDGFVLRFKKQFLGRYLLHGGVYPWCKLSCFRFGKGRIEQKRMDEHIVVEGAVIKLKKDSLHLDFTNLTSFIQKHNWYSSLEAKDYFDSSVVNAANLRTGNVKTWIKIKIYYHIPMSIRAKLYFIYRYYLRAGFLDGQEGRIYAFLQAYWYRYLVDMKIYEHRRIRR